MNEVLTKIAVEAQVEHCISHVRLQKFAELIVDEAFSHVLDYEFKNQEFITRKQLKEYFGVETW